MTEDEEYEEARNKDFFQLLCRVGLLEAQVAELVKKHETHQHWKTAYGERFTGPPMTEADREGEIYYGGQV